MGGAFSKIYTAGEARGTTLHTTRRGTGHGTTGEDRVGQHKCWDTYMAKHDSENTSKGEHRGINFQKSTHGRRRGKWEG